MGSKKWKTFIPTIRIERLTEKGHGVGYDDEHREIHVINALPGELVKAQLYKKVSPEFYAFNLGVLEKSPLRVEPQDLGFESSSPWQILKFDHEQEIKVDLLKKMFLDKAGVEISSQVYFPQGLDTYHYRNKTEMSFYVHPDDTISYGLFKRGTATGKIPIEGSALHPELVDLVSKKILNAVSKIYTWRELKFVVLRYSFSQKKVYARILFRDEAVDLTKVDWESLLDETFLGLSLGFSTRLTPGTDMTYEFKRFGSLEITDSVLGTEFTYGFDHFFQVYPPIFECAITDMKRELAKLVSVKGTLIDLYAGVGTIGILLSEFASKTVAVELSNATKAYALLNAKKNNVSNYEFLECASEKATEQIKFADILVVDPPRMGLAKEVNQAILQYTPEVVVYLSCNPTTQAMDFAKLKEKYEIVYARGYNFFPHTPHIEHLMILKRK